VEISSCYEEHIRTKLCKLKKKIFFLKKYDVHGSYWITFIWRSLAGILGGGFLLGSVVMIMEDADAPHHLLLLRCFMSQGVVHKQPLLFSGAMKEPRLFLGTLPAPVSSSKEDGRHRAMGAAASSDGRANVGPRIIVLLYL
jgi:elongator complex protein 4